MVQLVFKNHVYIIFESGVYFVQRLRGCGYNQQQDTGALRLLRCGFNSRAVSIQGRYLFKSGRQIDYIWYI